MNTDAYNAALRRLGIREYSRIEMKSYLEKKGFDAVEVDEVLAALVEKKFLDESRYARAVVRYQFGRGKGPSYIRARLKQKGVDLSTSEMKEILSEVGQKSELEMAREIVSRRYSKCGDRAQAQKAIQALLRRGFSYDIARQAVSKKALADES